MVSRFMVSYFLAMLTKNFDINTHTHTHTHLGMNSFTVVVVVVEVLRDTSP